MPPLPPLKSPVVAAKASAPPLLAGVADTRASRVWVLASEWAKRECGTGEARWCLWRALCAAPHSSAAWLELAKLEDEQGHAARSRRLLREAALHCPAHEGVFQRRLKLEERRGVPRAARRLLAALAPAPLGLLWRLVLDAALLEARGGRTQAAKALAELLLLRAPQAVPAFAALCAVLELEGSDGEIIAKAHEGLARYPTQAPLWTATLHAQQRLARSCL